MFSPVSSTFTYSVSGCATYGDCKHSPSLPSRGLEPSGRREQVTKWCKDWLWEELRQGKWRSGVRRSARDVTTQGGFPEEAALALRPEGGISSEAGGEEGAARPVRRGSEGARPSHVGPCGQGGQLLCSQANGELLRMKPRRLSLSQDSHPTFTGHLKGIMSVNKDGAAPGLAPQEPEWSSGGCQNSAAAMLFWYRQESLSCCEGLGSWGSG